MPCPGRPASWNIDCLKHRKVFVSWNIHCLKLNVQKWTWQVELEPRPLEVVLCVWHMCLKSWNIDCLKLYYMCIRNKSPKTTTSCTGCLARVCKLKHQLQSNLQKWTWQVELEPRPLEVVLYVWHMCLRVETVTAGSCTTCVSETRAQRQLQVALDVWHVFASWNINCSRTCKNGHVNSSWNLDLLKSYCMYGTCVLELKQWQLEVVLHVYHKRELKNNYKLHWMSGMCL
jgi:hypothetical protein